jgi:soluble lytic murein transglycosylase-like protein
LICVGPASAQIVSVLDEHGNRVFINVTPPPPKAAVNRSHSSAGSQLGSGNANTTNPAGVPSSTTGMTGASPAGTLTHARLEELVQAAATRHNVDPALVRAVIETESGGNPHAISRKGAMGLMQLMPGTAMQLGVRNAFSPQDNLDAGVRYLRTLLERYNGDLDKALAAYNAGAGAVDRAGGVPRYRETQDYVRKVTNNYFATNGSGHSGTPMKSRATPPPAHKMYQTVDAQGRTVWVNN